MRRVVVRLIAVLVTAVGAPAIAAAPTSNVLVLYSNGRLLPANVEGDRDLHQAIRDPVDRPVTLFYEFLDAPRFGGPAFDEVVAAYLHGKYGSGPPQVIVAIGAEALSFLLRQHEVCFPQVPVVHAGVDRSLLASLQPLPSGVVGVPVEYDYSRTLDLALRWHPRARRLVIVTGASEPDRQIEARLRRDASTFKDRATVEFLAGLPIGEVLKRLGGLGDDAVVFTTGFFRDGEGRDFTPFHSIQVMAAASAAPMYGAASTHMGTGIVGGYMPSYEAMGRQAGQIVNELLAGTEPRSLRLPDDVPQTLNVDWRQVQRWGIAKNAIPRDAVVHFKAPTPFEAHPYWVISGVGALVLQSGLIGWLLVEHRRRRLAESAGEARRLELARASRLAIAGELTGSIAHEINQPLGAILSNADAADLLLESGGDRSEELRGILADIRRDDLRASEVIRRLRTLLVRHEVERKPFDLGEAVCEIESLLGAEARHRRAALEVRPSPTPVLVVGDRVEIQQVVINMALNALDAVADLPDERRTVVVTVESLTGRAHVTVRDRGHGIARERLPRIFDAFFTTKRGGMGLGLSIARTVVESHGGRVWAENGPVDGAIFHVELPTAGGSPSGRR